MNRLTRKTNGKDYCIYCSYIEKSNEVFGHEEKPLEPEEYYKQEPYQTEYYDEDILNRLGELEDLQEELNCPFEIVFKALKDDEIYSLELDCFLTVFDLYVDALENWYFSTHIDRSVAVKDYKKTWILKKDLKEIEKEGEK